MRRATALNLLVLAAALLAGCLGQLNEQHGQSLHVREVSKPEVEEPATRLTASDVRENAPALADALQRASRNGSAAITDPDAVDRATRYLEDASGGDLPDFVEFDGEHFRVSVAVAEQ